MRTSVRLALLLLLSAVSLTACESTQDKSRRLAKEAAAVKEQKGLSIKRANRQARVLWASTLQDANGAATIIAIRGGKGKSLLNVPVAVSVLDAAGKPVYKNDTPGLDPSLTAVPSIKSGKTTYWVNDQVQAAAKPAKTKAVLGVQKSVARGADPKLSIQAKKLTSDPVDGTVLDGTVVNGSGKEQRLLPIYVVGLKGRKAVAAGKAQVPRLKAHGKAKFQVFFIGNPKGARLVISTPPVSY